MTRRARKQGRSLDAIGVMPAEVAALVLDGGAAMTDVAIELDVRLDEVSRAVSEERARRAAERDAARATKAVGPTERIAAWLADRREGDPLPVDGLAREIARLPTGVILVHVGDDVVALTRGMWVAALRPRKWARETAATIQWHERAGCLVLAVDWRGHGHLRGGLRLRLARTEYTSDDVVCSVRLGGSTPLCRTTHELEV